jgi:hypothetical protein
MSRLTQNVLRTSVPSTYVTRGPGYALTDINATQRLTGHIDGLFQIQNLTDHYQSDFSPGATASLGRQTKIGVRIRP